MDHDESPSLIINQDNFTLSSTAETSPLHDTQFSALDENHHMDVMKNDPSLNSSQEENDTDKTLKLLNNVEGRKRARSRDKPYTCLWVGCAKTFSSSYSLKSHYRVHTGEKPYVCSHCTKAFKTAGDLQKHTRTHTGEKPFKCPFEGCGKKFTTSHICKVHIRTHTGERPYKCPFPDCLKAFSTVTNYKNHVRIHTGEKPYACEVENCGKRFTEYSSFYKHQAVHSERLSFTCHTCGQVYKHATTLAAHQKTIHGFVAKTSEVHFLLKKPQASNGVIKVENSSNLPSSSKNINRTETLNSNSTLRNVLILPVNENQRVVDSNVLPPTTNEMPQQQQLTLVTTPSGLKLAFISPDGTTYHVALAEVSESVGISNNVAQRKPSAPTEQVMYVTTPESKQKDTNDALLEISAEPSAQSSAVDETPINTDIWLHQPNHDVDKSTDSVQSTHSSSEKDTFDSDTNEKNDADVDENGLVLEITELSDTQMSDPVAYFEIGGSKYQLKIVNDIDDKDELNKLTIAEPSRAPSPQANPLPETSNLIVNNDQLQCSINSPSLPQTVVVTLQDPSDD